MKRTWLHKILRVLLLVSLPLLVMALFLITTESGLRIIYMYASTYIPENITIGKIEGSLAGPITVHDVQYKNNVILIKSEKLTIYWSPMALLSHKIQVNNLHIQALNVNVLNSENKNTEKNSVNLPAFNFPWRIALNDVIIGNIILGQAEHKYNLKQVKLSLATTSDQINVKSLELKTERSLLNLSGKIKPGENYQHKFNINWKIKLPENETLTGKGRIQGNASKLDIRQQVGGPLQLSFNAEIRDIFTKLSWQAEANIIDINPAAIWNEWPGQFKGTISSHGHTENDQLIANIDIPNLNGTLRDYPVSLTSHFRWRDAVLNLTQFELHSGKTRLSAYGRIDSLLNLKWKLNSGNLAELYPEAKGSLLAEGQVTGSASAPLLSTSFQGKSLSLPGYKIAALRGNIGVDLFNWQQVSIELGANTLSLNEHELRSVDVKADNHNAQVKVVSDVASTLIQLKGTIDSQGIHGDIAKADLNSQQFSNWKLISPVHIELSKNNYSFDPLCVRSDTGKLCATLNKDNATWHSRIDINNLSLMGFSPWLHPDLKINGAVNATANIQFLSTGSLSTNKLYGEIHVKLPQGKMSYPLFSTENEDLSYLGGKLDININEQGLEANASVAISQEENIEGKISLVGVNILSLDSTKQSVQASIQARMNNFGLLESLIPDIQEIKGAAGLNIDISGTLEKPRIKGEAHLTNGIVHIPRLGLTINQFNLKSKSDGTDHLDFDVTAHSGQGHISIQGNTLLDYKTGWPTLITVKGDNFEVAHIPVSQLRVSPDLKIKLQNHSINISGLVHIPYAKLQPRDITTADTASDDIIIVGEEKSAEEKWLINTKVRLILGDRVHFYGFGFDGRFSGNLLLEDEPGQVTKASGEINVPEGRYTAYGQRLDVEHGHLIYSGSPITNPGLDIRAARHIDTVTAGLKVRGTLNNPQVELFSQPAMGQTDTLAYLLLGRPIENATGDDAKMMTKAALALSLIGGDSLARSIGDRFGLDEMRVESSSTGDQASLVIGRYLSPKLYIGYGVGLIESFNKLNVRYQISDKWQLKGESGENQGADLLYTIER